MSILDTLIADQLRADLANAPDRAAKLRSVAAANPIATLGLVAGLYLGATGSQLLGIGLVALGIWRLIGTIGILIGVVGLLAVGGVI